MEAQNQILTELYPPEDMEGEAEENEAPDHSDKEPEETKAEEQEESGTGRNRGKRGGVSLEFSEKQYFQQGSRGQLS